MAVTTSPARTEQHWWCWRRVIERLGGHYRLLVPDLRGFGWSEAPGTGYSAAGFAGDAVTLWGLDDPFCSDD